MVVTDSQDQANPSEIDNELRAFVSSTLIAIMKGVTEAQIAARAGSAHGTGEYAFSPPPEVAFDIAVHAKRSGSRKGGFKVEVFSIGANAGADASTENSTVSRIKFTIPAKFKKTAKRTKAARSSDRKTEASELAGEFDDE